VVTTFCKHEIKECEATKKREEKEKELKPILKYLKISLRQQMKIK